VLDAVDLILSLVLGKLGRFVAAVEYGTIGGKFWDVCELLGICRLFLGCCGCGRCLCNLLRYRGAEGIQRGGAYRLPFRKDARVLSMRTYETLPVQLVYD
jgi:hypothetical protein